MRNQYLAILMLSAFAIFFSLQVLYFSKIQVLEPHSRRVDTRLELSRHHRRRIYTNFGIAARFGEENIKKDMREDTRSELLYFSHDMRKLVIKIPIKRKYSSKKFPIGLVKRFGEGNIKKDMREDTRSELSHFRRYKRKSKFPIGLVAIFGEVNIKKDMREDTRSELSYFRRHKRKIVKKFPLNRSNYSHRPEENPKIFPNLIGIAAKFGAKNIKKPVQYIPTITNHTQLWWVPNVVVAHGKEGIEVVHLASGRIICKLHLQEGGLHADINGDVVLDHVQAVGGNGAEQTVVCGSMDVLRPCWAVATSGVPVRKQLFNASICHDSQFNLFKHGEFSRSFGRTYEVSALEVAMPILIPRDDAHRHRKGSHDDVVFLTNRGEVSYSSGLHGDAIWNWQLSMGATWSNLPSPSELMEGGNVVPTLKAFSLRVHDNQQMILAAGDREAVVISPTGRKQTKYVFGVKG